MARAYRMTSARRAAIKKAQRISAQRRKGKGRKKAVGAGIAAAGVIGVTMYAANGYGNRKRARKAAAGRVNVVAMTTTATTGQAYSGSKEIDIVRRDIFSSLMIERDPDTKKINYGLNYRAVGTDVRDNLPMRRWVKENKLNRNRRGRGKVVSSLVPNKTQKVKRNRPGFNDSRRKDYNREARAALYQQNAAKIKVKNDAKAAKKKQTKAIKSILSPKFLGRISIDSSGAPKSGWPLY
jgi:hypothetical protein